MERDLVDAGTVEGLLEAPHELRPVQWLAGLGMAEDEGAVGPIERPVAQLTQRHGHALAIGTDRPEPSDFGSPNSSRTYGETTRSWRDVDWNAQRIRVRNAWVRAEHSGEGKSDLSTRRSVPMTDRLARDLDRWSQRTVYGSDDDLVFAHPQSGRPLDRTKLSRRFKQACADAGVRVVRFHDLRYTFATRLAASGQPLRTIQEFLGHADSKTTQIYAPYAPSAHRVEMVNAACAGEVDPAPDEGSSSSEDDPSQAAPTQQET